MPTNYVPNDCDLLKQNELFEVFLYSIKQLNHVNIKLLATITENPSKLKQQHREIIKLLRHQDFNEMSDSRIETIKNIVDNLDAGKFSINSTLHDLERVVLESPTQLPNKSVIFNNVLFEMFTFEQKNPIRKSNNDYSKIKVIIELSKVSTHQDDLHLQIINYFQHMLHLMNRAVEEPNQDYYNRYYSRIIFPFFRRKLISFR